MAEHPRRSGATRLPVPDPGAQLLAAADQPVDHGRVPGPGLDEAARRVVEGGLRVGDGLDPPDHLRGHGRCLGPEVLERQDGTRGRAARVRRVEPGRERPEAPPAVVVEPDPHRAGRIDQRVDEEAPAADIEPWLPVPRRQGSDHLGHAAVAEQPRDQDAGGSSVGAAP